MPAPGPGGPVFAERQGSQFGPPNWGHKMGAQFWGLGLGKNPIRNLSPFGFPTFMEMNRQDPEENPPGAVAKVELQGLQGYGAILRFRAFRAISY